MRLAEKPMVPIALKHSHPVAFKVAQTLATNGAKASQLRSFVRSFRPDLSWEGEHERAHKRRAMRTEKPHTLSEHTLSACSAGGVRREVMPVMKRRDVPEGSTLSAVVPVVSLQRPTRTTKRYPKSYLPTQPV
jgi:phosphopantetheine adenylyltransferase